MNMNKKKKKTTKDKGMDPLSTKDPDVNVIRAAGGYLPWEGRVLHFHLISHLLNAFSS